MAQEVRRTLLEVSGEYREFALTTPSAHDYAMLEELSFVRREAQAEANQAYEDWRDFPGDETWTIYLAAADRADAAQDELADWARQLAACV
jgi:acyl-CoA reductase-like NAD-dependent aldehyde dehydrogenase